MAEFKVNQELFGCYAKIKTNYNNAIHIYKIVGAFASNHYKKVPLRYPYEDIKDNKLVPVANVIHCGIDETEVMTVALKDVESVLSNDLKTVLYTGKDFDYEVSIYE